MTLASFGATIFLADLNQITGALELVLFGFTCIAGFGFARKLQSVAQSGLKIDNTIMLILWSSIFVFSSFMLNDLAGQLAFMFLCLWTLDFMLKLPRIARYAYSSFSIVAWPLCVHFSIFGRLTPYHILTALAAGMWITGYGLNHASETSGYPEQRSFGFLLSRLFYGGSLGFLITVGTLAGSGTLFHYGVFIVILSLLYEAYVRFEFRREETPRNTFGLFISSHAYSTAGLCVFMQIDRFANMFFRL